MLLALGHAQTDPRLNQALPQIAQQAAQFWRFAPSYVARETLKQKAIVPSRRRLRIGQAAIEPQTPSFKDREIVSYYGFSAYKAAPEALHELRRVTTVDGKSLEAPERALGKLKNVLESHDDGAMRSFLKEFRQSGLGSSAVDFGQLILLFTRANLDKYSFELNNTGMVGADQVLIITFRQTSGNESLHISDAGKKVRRPLEGQLWVRVDDYRVMRIAVTAQHQEDKVEIRDEAQVEYTLLRPGLLLPAAVAHRRYVTDQFYAENVCEYSGWQEVEAK